MALHVFLFLLLSFLMLCLARLCHLYVPHHCLPHSRVGAVHLTCAGYLGHPLGKEPYKRGMDGTPSLLCVQRNREWEQEAVRPNQSSKRSAKAYI
jgi:hypothetical protein